MQTVALGWWSWQAFKVLFSPATLLALLCILPSEVQSPAPCRWIALSEGIMFLPLGPLTRLMFIGCVAQVSTC